MELQAKGVGFSSYGGGVSLTRAGTALDHHSINNGGPSQVDEGQDYSTVGEDEPLPTCDRKVEPSNDESILWLTEPSVSDVTGQYCNAMRHTEILGIQVV